MEVVVCPQCGKRLKAPEDPWMKGIRCPGCRKVFEVESALVQAPAAAPARGAGKGRMGMVALIGGVLVGAAALAAVLYVVLVVMRGS